MEEILNNAFDGFTVEELDSICPVHVTSELNSETFERIRNQVIARINAAAKTTSEIHEVPQPDTPSRKIKLIRTLLIAAIVVIFAAVSALAISLSGGRFLASLFGRDNYNIVEEYVMADIAQVSDGKYNLTLESALSDGHYHFVVFSVASVDGSSIGDWFPDVEFDFTLESPSRIKPGFQLERLDTDDSSDNCAFFIALIRSSQSAIRSMQMNVSWLYAFDGSLEDIPVALSVKADFVSCPLVTGGDSDSIFRNIELSPFGLWIDVFEAWEDDDSLSEGLPIYDIYLRYEDGKQIGAKAEQFADAEYLEGIGWGGVQLPNGTHQSYISIRFAQFVDSSKVKAIVINGQEYSLSMEDK